MPGPAHQPLGLNLAQTSKAVGRAFDDALAEAGGSVPVWLVLLSLKTRKVSNQRELAAAVGIQGATLTHHLNAMESEGLLTRQRDPANRRVHQVELTEGGEAAFHRLRKVAMSFDERLRAGIPEGDLAAFERTLAQLRANVAAEA
ncbi:MarR family winged helix-turn-helix transcriptional regulator [Saccharopolyspora oryzae]|uniref:MarR family winged helix-turn-helix transcriptional regulator n=1 Tax=Saccharopolyspora oryzae TaxID=2997343 RepID=A0ABT4UUB8_9PSEU|nr:MarR family winged helix-turn-helix transcriptional regulator [Saccharopolyspora oryzae]MDA3625298.1 MarR family winged helix-turn-helix transcriptional regulator [Saccharopolyspora oryzae]